jgi:ribosomal protein S18 acetylase RimI-like enzyme
MQVHSLGYRTDLIFPAFDGQILDRGDYLVILTLTNPTFYWGNFLLFQNPPGEGDLEKWKTLFAREIGSKIRAGHFAFGWDTVDGETGAVQPFLEAGFNLSQNVVLAAQQVNIPPKYNREAEVRPLASDEDWEQATQNQIACRDPEHTLEGYRVFKTDQMRRYRQMSQAGLGHWFGAFLGSRLVAELGVFTSGKLGRFQQVGTHPDYRRQGICGALVYQASRYALEKMNAETLVMVADENYHAAKIYESIGFQPRERQVGLDWWPKSQD